MPAKHHGEGFGRAMVAADIAKVSFAKASCEGR
jgi:hypothetical protein